MRPRFFVFNTWHLEPFGEIVDEAPSAVMMSTVPVCLRIRIKGIGPRWEDVLSVNGGIRLLAERTRDAFLAEGIRGLTFNPVEIVEVVKNKVLASRPAPNYYWGRAQGRFEYDYFHLRGGGGGIPIRITNPDDSDFLHFVADKGGLDYPAGYACAMKVVDVCRKHKIGNLNIYPVDFNPGWPGRDSFEPPFRIDLFGKTWPPEWYPAGFTPHASNQVEE